jgi:hypothetical protein
MVQAGPSTAMPTGVTPEPSPATTPLRAAERSLIVASLGLAVIDFCTHSVTLSILYTITMYVVAAKCGGRMAIATGAGLVALTFAGLFIGPRPPGLESAAALFDNFRTVNRGFSAVAIMGTGLIAAWQHRWHAAMLQRVEDDEDLSHRPIYLDLVEQVQLLTTLLIALCTTAALVAADWLTPVQFNLPTLYAVPLALCAISGSVRAVWVMTPVLLTLTWAGFFASPYEADANLLQAADVSWNVLGNQLVNRGIASAMLILLAIASIVASRGKGRQA